MEILELLFVLGEAAEACGCFVQLLAAVVDLSTVFTGVRAAKETRERRELRRAGVEPAGPNTKLIAFWVLLPFAVVATLLAFLALRRALNQ